MSKWVNYLTTVWTKLASDSTIHFFAPCTSHPQGGAWGEMVEFYTTFMQESHKTKEISRKCENNVEYIWINQ